MLELVVGKHIRRGVLFAVKKGKRPVCSKAERNGKEAFPKEQRGPGSAILYYHHCMFIVFPGKHQRGFQTRSHILLYNVKITVGNRFAGLLVILGSDD